MFGMNRVEAIAYWSLPVGALVLALSTVLF